jgi:hypothetical protein
MPINEEKEDGTMKKYFLQVLVIGSFILIFAIQAFTH